MHAPKLVVKAEEKFQRTDLPSFRAGDTIRVHARIKEGTKERTQIVEGIVLCLKGKGTSRTFTLRKISGGIGVEIVYPLCSKKVAKIEIVSHGKVRKSQLYHIRKLFGKAAKVKTEDSQKRSTKSNKQRQVQATGATKEPQAAPTAEELENSSKP